MWKIVDADIYHHGLSELGEATEARRIPRVGTSLRSELKLEHARTINFTLVYYYHILHENFLDTILSIYM